MAGMPAFSQTYKDQGIRHQHAPMGAGEIGSPRLFMFTAPQPVSRRDRCATAHRHAGPDAAPRRDTTGHQTQEASRRRRAPRRQARQARVQASSPASSISLTSASSPTTHHAGSARRLRYGKPSRQFTEVEPGGRPRLAKSLFPAMKSAHAPKALASHPHRNAWTRHHHNARQPRSRPLRTMNLAPRPLP